MGSGALTALSALPLTRLGVDTSFSVLLSTYVVFGVGFGLVNPPITNTAVSGMPRAQAGLAAAVASTSRLFGASLGVALGGTLGGATHAGVGFAQATRAFWWLIFGCGVLVTLLLNALVGIAWLPAACFALPLGVAAAPMSISGFYLSAALPLRPETITRVAGTVGSASIVTGAVWAAVGYVWWRALHALAVEAIDPGPAQPGRVTPILMVVGAMAWLGAS